jgi:hypothetical protein
MQANAESSERLVCAILAAQVAELRDSIESVGVTDLLWRTTDILSQLSGLLVGQANCAAGADGAFDAQCAAAVAAESEISRLLDSLAFTLAQRQDRDRQMAECIVTALERLAQVEVFAGARISPDDLAALYVTEDQRSVHDAVTRRFPADTVGDATVRYDESESFKGSGL